MNEIAVKLKIRFSPKLPVLLKTFKGKVVLNQGREWEWRSLKKNNFVLFKVFIINEN